MGQEKREPGTHCSRMCQVSLVTCILLYYTKIAVNFCSPPERPHCMVILPLRLIQAVFRSKTISTVTVCIASFKTIGKLQREGLRQSRAASFTWNEELSTFVVPLSSSAHSVISCRHLFLYRRSRLALRKLV